MDLRGRFPLIAALLLSTAGCSTVTQQLGAAKNFSDCEFRLQRLEDVSLGGTPASELLSLSKLTAALGQEALPLKMTLRYQVRNPNPVPAMMNRVEWILVIEDVEIMHGLISQKIELPPGPVSIAEFPVYVESDLKKVFTRKMASSIYRIGATLSGLSDRPMTIVTKVKPTIELAGISYQFKDYVEVRFELTPEKAKELRRELVGKPAAEPAPTVSPVPAASPVPGPSPLL